MKQSYEEIAKKLNAEFSFTEQSIPMADGSKDVQYIYYIKVPYNGTTITVRHHEGVLVMGDVFVEFETKKDNLNFSITTYNFIERLFRKKQNNYNIKGKDSKSFLDNCRALKEVLNLFKTSTFEPIINGTEGQTHFSILTEYNLLLEDKAFMIEPLVEFYKTVIDEFKK